MKIGQAIQQGEVYIRRIEKLSDIDGLPTVKKTSKGFILSHSESGNHHLLTDGELLERPQRAGMDCFYAILQNPEKVIQDAANPHEAQDLPAGFYDIRISREFDPFTQQARRVAD